MTFLVPHCLYIGNNQYNGDKSVIHDAEKRQDGDMRIVMLIFIRVYQMTFHRPVQPHTTDEMRLAFSLLFHQQRETIFHGGGTWDFWLFAGVFLQGVGVVP